MLEVLDTRLLSVLTWYHLSFLAVSVAMLGMAAGAVLVFVGGELFAPERAVRLLPAAGVAFALALPVSHVANLVIPFPSVRGGSPAELAALAIATLVLTIPFVLSGFVVTLALTRTRAPIGILYGADLLGAAAGCLAIIWLLELTDITSTALVSGGAAAIGAACFARYAGRRGWSAALLAVLLFGAAALNATASRPLGVIYPKSRSLWVDEQRHRLLRVERPFQRDRPHAGGRSRRFSGGRRRIPRQSTSPWRWRRSTAMRGPSSPSGTATRESLGWVNYDVTSLPYRIRSGDVAVIGVGGGRDILTAIAAGNTPHHRHRDQQGARRGPSRPYREFAGIANHPGVTLVHDEARSFLTRSPGRYDVLQMSLIDTWAATGAGAFTLSENGLYTRDGWQVFLRALTPTGVFSVSRWFDPDAASETTRLLSLGVASLLDFGVAAPRAHLILVTRERIATLLVSPTPFSDADGVTLRRIADELGFAVRVAPWADTADERLRSIGNAVSAADLRARHARSVSRFHRRRPIAGRSSSTCSSRAGFSSARPRRAVVS